MLVNRWCGVRRSVGVLVMRGTGRCWVEAVSRREHLSQAQGVGIAVAVVNHFVAAVSTGCSAIGLTRANA